MRFLITAGPTREAIDPVRFISNRSSGKMGYALAAAALEAGHAVTLISGPVCIAPPQGAELRRVTTADEMAAAVQACVDAGCDALVMCAAVADFKPREVRARKIKKHDGLASIELIPTRDILATLTFPHDHPVIVAGFAAESDDLAKNAQKKLREKRCDFICANDITRMNTGFDADENEVTIFFRDGSQRHLARDSKQNIAHEIVKICMRLAEKR
ncbi:MAG TPA: phosphopantothenoylcysteine decarboxylase [Chthoniobacteraceae bacterium]|jgi:phosphopantothenoylcysteine decarboxylase/phosphopantothenate--cysteine ligase|nr:phosphopantothenoylcysteine decarboxylase [Chthoniobacteraceae bacterium]